MLGLLATLPTFGIDMILPALPAMGAVLGAITITALVSYWILAGAGQVRNVMGETGIRILVRIMGLLLVALAMQFFVNGLTDLGLISKS